MILGGLGSGKVMGAVSCRGRDVWLYGTRANEWAKVSGRGMCKCACHALYTQGVPLIRASELGVSIKTCYTVRLSFATKTTCKHTTGGVCFYSTVQDMAKLSLLKGSFAAATRTLASSVAKRSNMRDASRGKGKG